VEYTKSLFLLLYLKHLIHPPNTFWNFYPTSKPYPLTLKLLHPLTGVNILEQVDTIFLVLLFSNHIRIFFIPNLFPINFFPQQLFTPATFSLLISFFFNLFPLTFFDTYFFHHHFCYHHLFFLPTAFSLLTFRLEMGKQIRGHRVQILKSRKNIYPCNHNLTPNPFDNPTSYC